MPPAPLPGSIIPLPWPPPPAHPAASAAAMNARDARATGTGLLMRTARTLTEHGFDVGPHRRGRKLTDHDLTHDSAAVDEDMNRQPVNLVLVA